MKRPIVMRRSFFLLLLVIISVLTIFITLWIYSGFINQPEKSETKSYYFTLGDSFLPVSLFDTNGKATKLNKTSIDNTIVFCLDKNCGSCINKLGIIENFTKIFSESIANIAIIWQNEYPEEIMNGKEIPKEIQYVVKNTTFSGNIPQFFVLDKNFNVSFSSLDINSLIKKVFTLDGFDELDYKTAADNALYREYAKAIEDKNATSKKLLIYLGMHGCSDCKLAEPILQKVEMQNIFSIISIYRESDKSNENPEQLIDYGNLYAKCYKLDWYPSFLIFHEKVSTIIGKTNPNNLLETLLQGSNCEK